MLETYIKSFLESGNITDSINILKECIKNKQYHTGKILGEYFISLFNNIDLLTETTICYYYCSEYRKASDIYDKILSYCIGPDTTKITLNNQHFCIDKISDDYIYYNPEIIEKIKTRNPSGIPMITFTITTCKRFNLFEKTINSFLNCCLDLEKINRWLCIDDNSSEEDRKKMKDLYPFFEFYFKTKEEKGHPRSMNIIKKMVSTPGHQTPYVFAMEDDWKFFLKRPYITQCLEILNENDTIKQCLINKNYAETSGDIGIIGGFPHTTRTGLRYFIHEHTKDDTEQTAFNDKYGHGANCSYWPHFSFRPSLYRTKVLETIGDFDEKVSHFEMNYSYKYRDLGYISAFLEGVYSLHIGRLTSERDDTTKLNAYILNNEYQLSGKEDSIPFNIFSYVLNLDRRKDRWDTFCKQKEPKCLKYERFSAIDGSLIIPSEQLQRIFDGNDYNMREGMVGCAMSHIKMYIELINSKYDAFCILEDDLEFVPEFREKFIEVYKALENKVSDEKGTDWDICYIGYHLWPHHRKDFFYDKKKSPDIVKWNTEESMAVSMGGTTGYLISKKGAKRLLEFINDRGMTNGIDTIQQKSADTLNVYYSIPQLVYSECWTPETSPDTDIQHNFRSLTIPVEQRINMYKTMYPTMDLLLCYEDAIKYQGNGPIMYLDTKENVKKFYSILNETIKKFCYLLEDNTGCALFSMKPNSTPNIYSFRYLERLRINYNFNIDEAVKCKEKIVISLGEMTHVIEAIQINIGKYPFDLIDEETIEDIAMISEKVLNMTENELKIFVKEFIGSTNIKFPHDTFKTNGAVGLYEVYLNRFQNFIKAVKSSNEIKFIYCTRFKSLKNQNIFHKLVDTIKKYNNNFKILNINGGEIVSDHIENISIEFPEKFRDMPWTPEKIKYDQEVFRLAIKDPITKFI